MPEISVIVPNYNHAPYLKERLDSIYQQSFTDFEVILLDDLSPDNSKEILEQYRTHPKTAHVIYNTINSGSTFKQWQKGLGIAKGKYIWIAESDDVADKDFLQITYEQLHANDNLGMAYVRSTIIDEKSQVLSVQDRFPGTSHSNDIIIYKGSDFNKTYMLAQNMIINVSACVFKKDVLDKIDFNEVPYKLNGDWLIYIKILADSDIILINQTLNFFRTHKKNVRSAMSKTNKGFVEYAHLLGKLYEDKMYPKSVIYPYLYTPLFLSLNYQIENKQYKSAFHLLKSTSKQFDQSVLPLLLRYTKYFILSKNKILNLKS